MKRYTINVAFTSCIPIDIQAENMDDAKDGAMKECARLQHYDEFWQQIITFGTFEPIVVKEDEDEDNH